MPLANALACSAVGYHGERERGQRLALSIVVSGAVLYNTSVNVHEGFSPSGRDDQSYQKDLRLPLVLLLL